jgi:ubiquitin-associated SH3 domain-containing protein
MIPTPLKGCYAYIPGLGQVESQPIAIEPGLFEWLAWYPDSLPDWMSLQELQEAGYNVKPEYKPFVRAEELHDRRESTEQFYMRSFYLAQSVIKSTADKGEAFQLDMISLVYTI